VSRVCESAVGGAPRTQRLAVREARMFATSRMVAVLAFDWSESNLPYFIGLTIVLLIGAAVIALVKRWRQRTESVSMSPSEQLAQYRSLYERGVMSKEEFDRLRALLGGQLREMKPPTPEPAPQEPNAAIRTEPTTMPAPPANANGIAPPTTTETGDRPV
jgi:hypothetical protein